MFSYKYPSYTYPFIIWNRGERKVFWWPNTNTNIIRFLKNERIRIQILFGFPKWPNTNTNIIRFPKNDWIWIRILFGYPEMTKCEYYWASQLWPNTNNIWLPKNDQILSTNTNFVEVPKRKAFKTSSESHKVMLNSPSPLITEANYKCK